MTAFVFPLIPSQQTMSIVISNVLYNLRVYWNDSQFAQCWVLDISDSAGNPIATAIPLVTGTDLLAQYPYLNFGGQLIVQTSSDTDAVPTFANLGTDGNLFFVTS